MKIRPPLVGDAGVIPAVSDVLLVLGAFLELWIESKMEPLQLGEIQKGISLNLNACETTS